MLSLISLSQTDSGTLKRYGHVYLLVLLMLYSMWSTGLLVDWILRVSTKTTFLCHFSKNAGNPWVYPVINWEEDPGNAMVTVAIGVVVCPLIHIFFWALTLFRNWIHRKLFLTTTLSIKTDSAYNNTAFNA